MVCVGTRSQEREKVYNILYGLKVCSEVWAAQCLLSAHDLRKEPL